MGEKNLMYGNLIEIVMILAGIYILIQDYTDNYSFGNYLGRNINYRQ